MTTRITYREVDHKEEQLGVRLLIRRLRGRWLGRYGWRGKRRKASIRETVKELRGRGSSVATLQYDSL